MKTKLLWIIGGVALLVCAGGCYAAYKYGQQHPTLSQTATKPKGSTATAGSPNHSASTPSNQQANITTFDGAGFLNASYTRKLTDFTPWADSPVTTEYRDFNADGVMDAFVWAKVPGTAGISYAAVWTLGSDGKPLELWHVPDDQILGHSVWAINGNNGLENSSLNSDGSVASKNTYHWQVSSTGKGFVLEPSI